ncbi:hypothetical protein H6G27_28250 [Nostoc linckia FACHB-104]|nr:hypothetical protein [Nostoc linckia FACHB-104]
MLAAEKSVTITIEETDLQNLKDANYKLCFAKKVDEGKYNVVWQSYDEFLMNNTFSWTPQYQLFGTNTFKENIKVVVSTNLVTIGLGEISTINKAGIFSHASTIIPETETSIKSINLDNEFGSIHPGVNQLSTGIDGQQISSPIYVAADPILPGTATLTPVETVLVWFEQNLETSTMFSTARAKSVEINLTDTNTASRKYQGGKWITP